MPHDLEQLLRDTAVEPSHWPDPSGLVRRGRRRRRARHLLASVGSLGIVVLITLLVTGLPLTSVRPPEIVDRPDPAPDGAGLAPAPLRQALPATCSRGGVEVGCVQVGYTTRIGLLTAPTVAGDTLYVAVGAGSGTSGVYALPLPLSERPAPRWTAATDRGVIVAPAADSDRVYVVDAGTDGLDGPDGRGSTVYAFDARDGRRLWTTQLDFRVTEHAPVIVGDDVIVVGRDYSQGGAPVTTAIFDRATGSPRGGGGPPARGNVTSVASPDRGPVVYYADGAGVHAYDLDRQHMLWSSPGDFVAFEAGGQRLVVGHFTGRISVVDAADGSVVWQDDTPRGMHFPPVVHAGIAAVFDDRDVVHIYNLTSGDKLAATEVPGAVLRGRGAVTSTVVALPTRDGLFAIPHSGNEVTVFTAGEEDQNQMSGAAVVDGGIVVTGAPGLYLLSLPANSISSAAARRVIDAFVAFATQPSPSTAADVPFSLAGVRLGLSDDLLRELSTDQLADPAAWVFERRLFRGYGGRFSALEAVRGHVREQRGQAQVSPDLKVSVGDHPHCASPPVPAPVDLQQLRRVSLQPADGSIESCLAWFTVDLFLNDDGKVQAVTLDLYEP